MNDIIERMRSGKRISEMDSDFPRLCEEIENTRRLVGELNTGYHTPDEVRALLERIWGQTLDAFVRMFPPFYTAFGKTTRVGKDGVHQLRLHVPRLRRHHTRRRCIHRTRSENSDGTPSRRTGFAASAAGQARNRPPQRVDRCGCDDTAVCYRR